jgi:hypothetical protein
VAGAVARRDGAIPLLEEAVELLRQAPLDTLLCHWVGSAPFALVVLWFWDDLANPRTLDTTGALEAFVLTIMLVWMNCWRAVFAGRLRRQLSGVEAPRWTAGRVWRLMSVQAFVGATKLLVMPLAWLTMFPVASAIAFYRNVAVLSDRDDLDAFQLMAKARKLANVQTTQSWALLLPLGFLYLLVTVNLGIVLGVLPQLVRMLSGYESSFSRSGAYFAQNPLFFLLVIGVSWIAFDPFIQAVYCVRCFRGESLETGEDLRSALRRIVTAAASVLSMLVLAHSLVAAVPPAQLEKSVKQAMQSHEYDWRLPPQAGGPSQSSWLVRLADKIVVGMKAVSESVGKALRQLFKWLMGNRGSSPEFGAPPAAGLHWSIYVAIGAVVLIAILIVWRGRRRTQPVAPVAAATVVRLDAEELTADRLPEEKWLELAGECLREQNYRLALRALYLANLAWLGRSEWIVLDAGKTNREYDAELRRRARAHPEARTVFVQNLAVFERTWYGLHEVGAGEIEEYRSRLARMKEILAA